MLSITVSNENCPCCHSPLQERLVIIEDNYKAPRQKNALTTNPAIMYDNSSDRLAYACWHCDDFKSIDNALLSFSCPECGSDIVFAMGMISKFTKKQNDESYIEAQTATTFLKWLAQQKERNDMVGDFAREFFWTKDAIKQGHKVATPPANTNDYLAMRDYVHSWKGEWWKCFEMAWQEFLLIRNAEWL